MARKIEVEIVGDSRSLERAFGRARSSSRGLSGVLAGAGKAALVGAAAAGAAALTGIGVAAKLGFDEFKEAEKVGAQTNAVITSTGGVANVTAKHVDALATALMRKSGVDDEAIATGQNMLLTFKQIRNEAGAGNDVFDQATKATLDLSVAMGTDMQDSAVMVGKALNDPITGLTALRRVGIQFTAAQEKQIKKMTEAGNVAGAQKMILAELESQFGGSAEAAGKTLPGQLDILKQTFLNTAGAIVGRFVPVLVEFAQFVAPLILSALDGIGRLVDRFVAPALGRVADTVSDHWPGIITIAQRVWGWIQRNVFPIVLELWAIVRETWRRIMGVLRENEPQLRRIFGRIGSFIRAVAKVALPILRVAFVEILPRIISVVINAVDKITLWLGKIIGFVRDMRGRLSSAAEGIRSFFGPDGGFRRPFAAVKDWVGDRVDQMVTFFRNLPGRMADAIRAKAETLKNAVFDILRKALPSWAEDALGISSPSKVFEKIGNAVVDGLIVGIKNKAGDLKDAALAAVGQLPTKLTGVGIEGTGPGNWQDLAAFANQMGWPVTSGFRPGDDGLHGQGKAIDVDAGSIQANAQVFFAFLRAFAGRINELFFDPIGWYIDQGRRIEGAIGDHMDHVHVALFGKGGIVTKPILGVVGEAGPEAVIPLGRGGGALAGAGPTTIVLQNHGVLGSRREVIAWLKDAVDDYKRANGGREPF